MNAALEPMLLTEREAARRLAISVNTLKGLRKRAAIGYVRTGGRLVRYTPEQLAAYVAVQSVGVTRG